MMQINEFSSNSYKRLGKRSQSDNTLTETQNIKRPRVKEKGRSNSSVSMLEYKDSSKSVCGYVSPEPLVSFSTLTDSNSESLASANSFTTHSPETSIQKEDSLEAFDYEQHRIVELIIYAPMVLAFGSYEGTFVTYHEDQDMHRADMFTSTTNGEWGFNICLLKKSLFSNREQLDDNYVDDDAKRSEIRVETEIGIKDVLERIEAHLELNIGYFKSNSQYLTTEFDMKPQELEHQQGKTKLLNRLMSKLLGSPHRDECTVQNFKLISTRASGSLKATAECGDKYVLFSREI